MTDRSDPPSPEVLLEHATFLRALARSLVLDPARADDVVQQTLLTALERPPRHGGNLRSWLGKVARNLAFKTRRTEQRRQRREERAARPEGIASPEEVASRLELQRRVAEAVHALKEPYRSTLVHRFFDDLSPDEIARGTDTPVETVRTRLRRGLDQIRARLDAGHGGDRRAWCLGLVPLITRGRAQAAAASAGAGTTFLLGATLMSAKTIAAALVVVVATTALLLWEGSNGEQAPDRRAAHRRAPPAPAAAGGAGAAPSPEAHGAPSPAATTPPSPDTRTVLVRGVVRDEEGRALPGATVVHFAPGGAWEQALDRAETDEQGRFTLRGSSTGWIRAGVRLKGYVDWKRDVDPFDGEQEVVLRRGVALGVRVVDPDGRPLPGVEVIAYTRVEEGVAGMWTSVMIQPFAKAATDAEGRADLQTAPPGKIEIRADHEGFAQRLETLVVEGTKPIEHRVVLGRGGAVEGRVLDLEGKPVAGARVFSDENIARFTKTKEDGSYRLEAVGEGPQEIHATAPGYGGGAFGSAIGWGEPVDVPVRAGRTLAGVDIVLTKPRFVGGRVEDDEGRPVEGVEVIARSYRGLEGEIKTHTGKDGRFRVGPFAGTDRSFVFRFKKEGYVIGPLFERAVDTDIGDVQALRHGGVRGRVVMPDGSAPRRSRVWLLPTRSAHPVQPDGTFEILGIAATNIELHAEATGTPRLRSRGVEVRVQAGELVDEVELRLVPLMEISGRVVTPDGRGRPGIRVEAHPADAPEAAEAHTWDRTDADGRFALERLPRDTYDVGVAGRSVELPDGGAFWALRETPAPVRVSESRTDLELQLPVTGGRIEGRVLSKKTRSPLRTFQVHFIRFKWLVPQGFDSGRFQSDRGTFAHDVDEPGTWVAEVKVPGYAPQRTKPFTVKKGETKDVGEILIGEGGTIAGVVKDARGRPIPYARVHILSATLETNEDAPFTDADGAYEVPAIAPGTYQVFAVSPRHPLGIARSAQVKENETTRVDFELALPSPLELTILDPDGAPVAGAEVTYTFEAVRPLVSNMFRAYEPPGWGPHRTDRHGRLTKTALPAGDVTLFIQARGFRRLQRTVTLTAGKPTSLTVQLERTE
ncbi:MAG: sigma-70 family RNA polymerase sigma factor [Planctomycetota bacterium]